MWISAPKGRDVKDKESDGGGMAPDYYLEGGIAFARVLVDLRS